MSTDELEAFVEAVDPDWRDHFLTIDLAYEFYQNLENEKQDWWCYLDQDEQAIKEFCNGTI